MKISIIGGAGRVGSAIGFALFHACKMDEIVLVDVLKDAVQGEALDLAHAAVALTPLTKVTGTDDISRVKGSDIVIIVAGKARTTEKRRDDLFEFNKKIMEDVSEKIKKLAPDSSVIVVTNPSTRLGKVVQDVTGFPKERIIIMDNQLDTARLRYYISKEIGKNIVSLKSYVKGEHGEGMEFVMEDGLSLEQEEKVKNLTKETGPLLIKLKGHTSWGIVAHVVEEVKKLL